MLSVRACGLARRSQAGVSLLESLVAILILALGIAGLAGTQARLLVEGRHASARASAIVLIGDLSDRMRFNQATAAAGGYHLAWGEIPIARDCSSSCTGGDLAQSDLGAWRAAVSQMLPLGDATVFQATGDPRQIGIAIAWPMQEGPGTDASLRRPFAVTAATHGIDCPIDQHCHVVYVLP